VFGAALAWLGYLQWMAEAETNATTISPAVS
jgi:hypothetical protein